MTGDPLAGHVVVVTGASSGIGRLAALDFARRGASVLAAARNERGLRTLEDESRALPGELRAVPTDVAEPDQMARLAAAATDTYGRIDTWVNNASVMLYAGVEQTTPEELRRILDVNVVGLHNGMLAAMRAMRSQERGTIINIGSVESLRALPLHGAYAASKHAAKALTEALRVELAHEKSPIRVVLIEPSYVNTPLFEHARSKIGARPQPLPPMYQPEAVVEAIVHTALEPVDEVVVGGAGKALTFLERVSPWLVDRLALVGGLGIEAQRSDRPAAPRDNLFEPLDEPGAVHGEWESISRDRSWYTRTIGLRRTAARAIGLAAAAGIGVLVARRNQAGHRPG